MSTKKKKNSVVRQSDFMFCETCGTMLSFDSRNYVRCPLCLRKKKTEEVAGMEIKYTVSEEQIRRELGLSSIEVSGERTRSMDYNVICPKCSNKGVYYHTQQTRSADEGQTMFYNCPNCGYNFTDNT
ncbi:DNA-directed RNA polymerase I subunit RPA12-like [Bidens hawaiensis]|uniref:DNA-directed RNA polymerase I subunit RPA12-like n=1 Tax=Bidens hawaiensis TaxID=980011 RepID=UPI00404A3247